jgi:hypothetical protein
MIHQGCQKLDKLKVIAWNAVFHSLKSSSVAHQRMFMLTLGAFCWISDVPSFEGLKKYYGIITKVQALMQSTATLP